ncbi:MAG TPA: hypothetical protein VLG36_04530 [Candidatus Chromulinivoraceae bacterium]|nr:hypothetical protein [Candidatus Chromulinivoraceae bacterium]
MEQFNNQLTPTRSLSSLDISSRKTSIELLRQILIAEQHREVVYDEALSIGESLIEFFQVLSSDAI